MSLGSKEKYFRIAAKTKGHEKIVACKQYVALTQSQLGISIVF